MKFAHKVYKYSERVYANIKDISLKEISADDTAEILKQKNLENKILVYLQTRIGKFLRKEKEKHKHRHMHVILVHYVHNMFSLALSISLFVSLSQWASYLICNKCGWPSVCVHAG